MKMNKVEKSMSIGVKFIYKFGISKPYIIDTLRMDEAFMDDRHFLVNFDDPFWLQYMRWCTKG